MASEIEPELKAMEGFIELMFDPWDEFGQPAVFDSLEQSLYEGDQELMNKADKYKTFLKVHQLKTSQGLCEALRNEMQLSSCFEYALGELPQKLVCMIVMLARLERFELVHAAVNEILSQAKSDSRKLARWASSLNMLLTEISPGWYQFPGNDLDYVLSVMIVKRARVHYNIPWSTAPRTVEKAFHHCVWPGLELLSSGKLDLSKDQINKIMIIAAQNDYRDLFRDCVQRGAEYLDGLWVTVKTVSEEHGLFSVEEECTFQMALAYYHQTIPGDI